MSEDSKKESQISQEQMTALFALKVILQECKACQDRSSSAEDRANSAARMVAELSPINDETPPDTVKAYHEYLLEYHKAKTEEGVLNIRANAMENAARRIKQKFSVTEHMEEYKSVNIWQ